MEERVQIVALKLTNGSVVKVSARSLGGEEDVLDWKTLLPFSEITTTIESIARDLAACIETVRPDKASVEFGVDIGVEAGKLTALLASGAVSGNLKVKLEWKGSTSK